MGYQPGFGLVWKCHQIRKLEPSKGAAIGTQCEFNIPHMCTFETQYGSPLSTPRPFIPAANKLAAHIERDHSSRPECAQQDTPPCQSSALERSGTGCWAGGSPGIGTDQTTMSSSAPWRLSSLSGRRRRSPAARRWLASPWVKPQHALVCLRPRAGNGPDFPYGPSSSSTYLRVASTTAGSILSSTALVSLTIKPCGWFGYSQTRWTSSGL